MKKLLYAVALAGAFAGCSTEDANLDNVTFVQELKGGCRAICPRCKPGEPCPLYMCYEDCNGHAANSRGKGGGGAVSGEPCGATVCGEGLVCCNASCSMCAPPDMFCIQIACEPELTGCTTISMCADGYVWDEQKCDCVPAACGGVVAKCAAGYEWDTRSCTCKPVNGGGRPGSCTTDADCRVEADSCTACDCVALSTNEKLAACQGPGVRCFADPCMGKAAACVNGTCQVVDVAIR